MHNQDEPAPNQKRHDDVEAPQDSAAPQDSVQSALQALAAARSEASNNRDRYLRAAADLENYRRRAAREKEEIRQFACEGLLTALLPVLDNLALASNAARHRQSDSSALANGVEMVFAQLRNVLSDQGLVELTPTGEPFDPHRHEAISHENDTSVPEGHVISVVRSGYSFNTRLLRPASVVISKGPTSNP